MDSRRLIKPIRPPLLLKDHLLDDMSSCSSSGFKSYPRRQCCTSVRFLHESDRKINQKITYVDLKKPPSKSALTPLQSFITAVKRISYPAANSPEKKKSSINLLLPRSISKKLFKNGGFWKRKPEHREIEPWKTFDQLLKEDPIPNPSSDLSCSSITTTDVSKSYSWSGSDFTASEGGKYSSEANSNLPEAENDVVRMAGDGVSGDSGVGVTYDDVSAESTTNTNSSNETKKQWSSDQEKEQEQFSPASVLDCSFDEDDDASSPFQCRLARVEGTRKKLLKKIQRFECLAKLEPVSLTRRFSSHLDSDNESSDSHIPHSEDEDDDEEDEEEDEEDDEEEKALELLDRVKASTTSHGLKLKMDNLMLDFFKEGITREKQQGEVLVEMASDWICGRKADSEAFMEWEVEKKRQAYVEDMEKGERKRLGEAKEEVGLELGNEVFAGLLNELLQDITT